VCCSSPGAKGNPLCWDHLYSYEKCCTETVEGQRFHHRRLKFIDLMVERGATVTFDIRQIEGTGRSGAVSIVSTKKGEKVLQIPRNQSYGLDSLPDKI